MSGCRRRTHRSSRASSILRSTSARCRRTASRIWERGSLRYVPSHQALLRQTDTTRFCVYWAMIKITHSGTLFTESYISIHLQETAFVLVGLMTIFRYRCLNHLLCLEYLLSIFAVNIYRYINSIPTLWYELVQLSLWETRESVTASLLYSQLGIEATTPTEFLSKAKEIVVRHRDLQVQVSSLQDSMRTLETEGQKLVSHFLFTRWLKVTSSSDHLIIAMCINMNQQLVHIMHSRLITIIICVFLNSQYKWYLRSIWSLQYYCLWEILYSLTRVITPLCRLMCYICRINVVTSTCAGQVVFKTRG